MTSLRFMGIGEPEEVRGRVYDGTGDAGPLYWWNTGRVVHLWRKRSSMTDCGQLVVGGELGELEPGADFGVSSADCLACAKAVVR
jgi:hypothetical protein